MIQSSAWLNLRKSKCPQQPLCPERGESKTCKECCARGIGLTSLCNSCRSNQNRMMAKTASPNTAIAGGTIHNDASRSVQPGAQARSHSFSAGVTAEELRMRATDPHGPEKEDARCDKFGRVLDARAHPSRLHLHSQSETSQSRKSRNLLHFGFFSFAQIYGQRSHISRSLIASCARIRTSEII